MLLPRTIVCGFENVGSADVVVDTARSFANALRARLVLMHAAEGDAAAAKKVVASIRVRLSLGNRDDVQVVEGSPAERLLEAGERERALLLVVGSRGRGAVDSALFGSVSRTLVTTARCPVAVVPRACTALPDAAASDGTIVCGVDGSDHSRAAARLAGALATRMGCRLLVVHALSVAKSVISYPGARATAPTPSSQPDARERLAAELVEDAVSASGVAATGIVESGLPWEVLEAVADRERARTIVVAARGLSAVRAALFGSAAVELASSSRRPVVLLPEAAEARVDELYRP